MKNLSRILFFCFFIFSPFIVLAHIDPFSYTTTGQIPSVTATGES